MSTSRWAWWHRQRPATRQTIRGALAIVLTGLFALVVGVSTASVEAPLGPHEARYDVTLNQEIRLDLGPLGAMVIDSPLPWPLGVDVVVAEIPSETFEHGQNPLPGLVSDVEAYGQLFTVPEAALADAANALVADAAGRTLVLWSVLLVALAAGRLASRGRLRDETKDALARPGVAPLAGAAVLALGAVVIVPATQQREAVGRPITLFDGTPLEGARVTGRLGDLIDTYGIVVRNAFEENQRFYADLGENLAAAYEADAEPLAPAQPPGVDPQPAEFPGAEDGDPGVLEDGGVGVPDGGMGHDGGDQNGVPDGVEPDEGTAVPDGVEPDRATAVPDGAEPDQGTAVPDGRTDSPDGSGEESSTEPSPEPEPVTFLVVSDLHCNVGMAEIVASAVQLSGASAVLDAGDTVMSGTSVESFCINAFAGAVGGTVPWLVSTGNHDSTTTADQGRAAGFTVLDGSPVDVEGVRILGDTDPTLTSVGEGTRPERDETTLELGERMARTACEDGDVDLLLIHNPRAGEAALESGCVALQISGHWHRRMGPEVFGQGVRYVSTSSGGGAEGGRTMGPLQTPAEMTVVRVDAATGAPLDYRVLTFSPDASVTLGQWWAFPEPAEPPVGPTGQTSDEVAAPLPEE